MRWSNPEKIFIIQITKIIYFEKGRISFVPMVSTTTNLNSTMLLNLLWIYTFKNMGQPRPLFRLLLSFKQKLQFLQQINVINVHLVYGTGIRTRDLWNMTLLPKPLDQYLTNVLIRPMWRPRYINTCLLSL